MAVAVVIRVRIEIPGVLAASDPIPEFLNHEWAVVRRYQTPRRVQLTARIQIVPFEGKFHLTITADAHQCVGKLAHVVSELLSNQPHAFFNALTKRLCVSAGS